MDKQVTKEQIGSIVTLLVAGKVPFKDAQGFIDRYKSSPSKKKRKLTKPQQGSGGGIETSWDEETQIHRIYMSYAKLPGFAVLELKFSGVSSLFDGRAWKRHSSCAKIDETPGEREFLVSEIPVNFLRERLDAVWNDLAAHFDSKGYRFAIETEAVEFAHAQPELQHKNSILALGSSALNGGGRHVSLLGADRGVRLLSGHWVASGLRSVCRLLLVRK